MGQKIRQDMFIGPTIRKMRMDRGMTQEQVITKMQLLGCNTSRSSYSQIEVGTYNVRVSELAALKVIFKADYADFFQDIKIPVE